ncbi:MAG: glutaredoxin [candidate division Zixibacteria bacterium SM1_73]|nr:MAG: glutaredoxin [candidate division Zixibacteria bacterium SM1_73]
MDVKHVKGKDKGHIMMFALSTCGWCKKTKRLLNELGVEYHYTDVDLLEGKKKEGAMEDLERWNPKFTFPTLVVKNKCIVGYDEEKIKEAIGV